MKIHEKIMTHYLSCTSPVDKEGYLYKKKEQTATYQRRWFVLKANLLFYQERPADRHLLGVIVLERFAVQCSESDGPFSFSLVFGPGLKTYRLAAGDHLTQESWVKALLPASHCFLSQLVIDLGRQYEGGPGEHRSRSGDTSSSACPLYPNSLLLPVQVTSTVIREGRSFSASAVLQAPSIPTKAVVPKKSPKLWPRRNAYVTPLNGPAPLYGEWPLVGSDPLVEFSKLHYHYGQEVKKARDEWLRSRQPQEDSSDRDLIDLE
uniref:Sesquipedalian n=2 Tax=Nothobranchius furzeri TaxID=105023 RepID=A0A8C6LRG3_NOTFU